MGATRQNELSPDVAIERAPVPVWLVGLAVILALAIPGCAQRPPQNVIVIVIDTLRADRLGAYGNRRDLTPFLDELAQRGTVFVNAFATSSWTCPSVASIMTSRDPRQHRVNKFGVPLGLEERTFAEVLHGHGYRTAGFSANPNLVQRLGYAQGFDWWRAEATTPGGLRAAELQAQGLEWLDRPSAPQPTLLYFQFMEPHGPYEPPEPFRSRFTSKSLSDKDCQQIFLQLFQPSLRRQVVASAEQLYDGEVAAMDSALRTLFGEFERRRLLDGAIVIITADHGEEFLEHDCAVHGRTLFDNSVRVPLIIIADGYGSGRVDSNVSLLDLGPTIVDLLGLPRETSFEGQSLVPLLSNTALWGRFWNRVTAVSAPVPRDILFQLDYSGLLIDNRLHREGILRGAAKMLVGIDGKRLMYHLAADRSEQHPNPPELAPATELEQALRQHASDFQHRAAAQRDGETPDDAAKERLRALGYDF